MPERNDLEAVLWDLDGVIADTAEYHYQAWRHVFAKRGVNFTWQRFKRHFGRRHDTIIVDALGDKLTPEEFAAVTEEKQSDYRRRLAGRIRALPGAITLLKNLKERGIRQAIASSAPMPNINIVIRGLGIQDDFQAIASGPEVPESKPSPAIFLLAARKLGASSAGCVVIEDAIAGVAAAKKAGMKCIAVTSSHAAASLRKADLIVPTLESVDIDVLNSLFRPALDK